MDRTAFRRGMSLLELMVVVAIIGVLAAIAIPSFSAYLRRAKSAEAMINLRRLFDLSVARFEEEQTDESGHVLPRRFPPSREPTPALDVIGSKKVDPTEGMWEGWDDLGFRISDPFYYAYQYDSGGSANNAFFVASAFGNLDNDESYSTFLRVGLVSEMQVRGSPGVWVSMASE